MKGQYSVNEKCETTDWHRRANSAGADVLCGREQWLYMTGKYWLVVFGRTHHRIGLTILHIDGIGSFTQRTLYIFFTFYLIISEMNFSRYCLSKSYCNRRLSGKKRPESHFGKEWLIWSNKYQNYGNNCELLGGACILQHDCRLPMAASTQPCPIHGSNTAYTESKIFGPSENVFHTISFSNVNSYC